MRKKKYWYFQFDKRMMFSPEFRKMEALAGGYEYEVILLKLYSATVDGIGTLAIPSTAEGKIDYDLLSEVILHRASTIPQAVEYFEEHGLLEIIPPDEENEDKFLVDIPDLRLMLGLEANRRTLFQPTRNEETEDCVIDIPPEEIHPLSKFSEEDETAWQSERISHGTFKNVWLTENEYSELSNRYLNPDFIIERLSIWVKKTGKDLKHEDYAWVLDFASKDGKPKNLGLNDKESLYSRYKKEALIGYPPPYDAVSKGDLSEEEFEELMEISDKVK